MNRTRLALPISLLLTIALAGCGSPVDPGASGTPAAPSPSTGDTTVAPSPQKRIWGGFAVSFPYGSFAEWAREVAGGSGGGVAIVRIVDVSGIRWSTASGESPGPADIARANQGQVEFTIGRLVSVELDRMLRGTWPSAGDTALYWLPGGQIGLDVTPTFEGDARLSEPRPGGLAVASTFAGTDMDGSDGVLLVNVQQLFPADPSGRLRTFRPDETIMIGDIERYLPAP